MKINPINLTFEIEKQLTKYQLHQAIKSIPRLNLS